MKKTVILVGMMFALIINANSSSLKVSPAGIIVHNVIPGKEYDLYKDAKIKLAVYNDDDTTHTYLLRTHIPSEVGKWEKGYLEIPDASWMWFKDEEITVSPQTAGLGYLYLKIPEKDAYYNQHWVATLSIKAKVENSLGIGLGILVRAQIETQSSLDVKENPQGIIAFKPSIVEFDNLILGETKNGSVVIYNNDSEKHSYKVSYYFQQEDAKIKDYLTQSYKPIPNSDWIDIEKKKFNIKAGESKVLEFKIKIPDGEEYLNQNWEELIWIQPDESPPGFFRIRINAEAIKAD